MELALPLVCDDKHDWYGPIDEWLPEIGRKVDGLYGALPDHEKAALVSFASDCGWHALARSTVRQLIDLDRKRDAGHYWLQWCRRDGEHNALMFERRKVEFTLYLTGEYFNDLDFGSKDKR